MRIARTARMRARVLDRVARYVIVELRGPFSGYAGQVALDAGWAGGGSSKTPKTCLLEQAMPMCASCAGQRVAVIARVQPAELGVSGLAAARASRAASCCFVRS